MIINRIATVVAEPEFLTQLIRKFTTVQMPEPGLSTSHLNVTLPYSYFTWTISVMFSLQNSVSIQSPAILAMGPAYCYQLHFTVLTNNRVSSYPRCEDTRGMEVHFHLFLTSARDCISGEISRPRPRCDWEEASCIPHRQSG